MAQLVEVSAGQRSRQRIGNLPWIDHITFEMPWSIGGIVV
jgi:hypothetical protein